jgi:hypothetical protein
VIADTNAPDEDHWWPIMSGEAPVPDHFSREEALMLVRPDTWSFHTQPGGMREKKDKATGEVTGYEINPDAENLKNLTPNYYPNIIKGKGRDWIGVYVLNRLGSLNDGKPVYPDWDEEVHAAREPLLAIPGVPIIVGVDFGLTPAAVMGQSFRGRWLVLRELVANDMGVVRFAQLLRQDLAQWFPAHFAAERIQIWGDPAGDYRAQTDEATPFQMMRNAGLIARPAPGNNDVSLRLEAMKAPMLRTVDKAPGLLVDPSCTTLKRGFAGGYRYRRLAVAGAERFAEVPDKNKFSHVHDAGQYMMLGGGEGRALVQTGQPTQPVVARAPYDPFNRKTKGPRPRSSRFT